MMTIDSPEVNGTSVARAMLRSVRSMELSDLSAPACDKLKICLLDFLSCAFEAHDLPWSRQATAIAAKATSGATILGSDVVAPAADAAFANATLGHGLVREDMHAGSIGHHGVVIWPVLLALAQRNTVSGARFLTAAAIGYEIGGRIGRALFTADLALLFRPTGILGPLAGAAAGGYLLSLPEDAAVSALALAANTASGLNQWPYEGGSDMYFHPGFAARGAITSIALAQAGAYGSENILEGEGGLFAAFRRAAAPAAIQLFPDGQEEILAVYNKPVPACNFAQTACQAAIRVAEEVDSIDAIESVAVHLPEAAIRYPGCDFNGPFERALQAKMSIQYGVAAALVRKAVAEENYRRLDDPAVLRLARLTRLKRDADFTTAFPDRQGAEVEVSLSTGARISRRITDVIAATEGEIRVRFRAAAGAVLGPSRADAIEQMVDRLERAEDAGRVAALCAPHLRGARPRSAARAASRGD
ncbi:MmgE/PrpD family protein [Limobrevibacterium gyesilva]|uniref:MmgE/PrpD family protein n=1 Tax=Limobrevibacterium gyesilva TaxID=2991712 RepID=A0AA42CHD9_9PROT|nr:MmgE/PrpD family protein [Limobrevibacterium gyesilva]MCW3474755.1 MmgE/PrpD family protein [Limobrevibacterium gyesilva]